MSDKGGGDALPLSLRGHRDRAEDLDRYELLWCVQEAASEHDVPEDLAGVICNQRERRRIVPSQRCNEFRHDRTVVSKGMAVNIEDCFKVVGPLGSEIHVRRR